MMGTRISERFLPTRTALRHCEIRLGQVQQIVVRYAVIADDTRNPELNAIVDDLWLVIYGHRCGECRT